MSFFPVFFLVFKVNTSNHFSVVSNTVQQWPVAVFYKHLQHQSPPGRQTRSRERSCRVLKKVLPPFFFFLSLFPFVLILLCQTWEERWPREMLANNLSSPFSFASFHMFKTFTFAQLGYISLCTSSTGGCCVDLESQKKERKKHNGRLRSGMKACLCSITRTFRAVWTIGLLYNQCYCHQPIMIIGVTLFWFICPLRTMIMVSCKVSHSCLVWQECAWSQ